MPDFPSLDDLIKKVGELAQRQQKFQNEINDLQRQIFDLKRKDSIDAKTILEGTQTPGIIEPVATAFPPLTKTEPVAVPPPLPPVPPVPKAKKIKTPIEEFIGTNLLNKIGIAVLVIGVGIGAEYAIDHDLIRPLTRILLGYLCGVVLIVLAIRLKPKYQSFSAVLLSGGMAVLYFITFAAYDLYQLIPQTMAFILMVVFTAFTVFAALQYNLRVIAIIGLVGAYAVPFLLSDGSGRVVILFTYMTIVNLGILILAFKKEWKQLYYLAFVLTWLIYSAWYLDSFDVTVHLWTAMIFSTVFFITFYITLLAYKLLREEPLSRWDVVLLLLNSLAYYGFGYASIESHERGEMFLGLFTLFNAILHFLACFLIFTRKGQSKEVFYFAAALVLVFLTLAVPVQLEGNWVTIIWAAEAALLFWLGRTKRLPTYEVLSYPLIALAFGSLLQDWDNFYGHYSKDVTGTYVRPFLNIQLLVSLMVTGAFAWIAKLNVNQNYKSPVKPGSVADTALRGIVPALFLVTLFFSFYLEVNNFWQQKFVDSQITVQEGTESTFHMDYDLVQFQHLWILNYAAFFTFAVALANLFWVKNRVLGYLCVGFGSLILLSFVSTGIVNQYELRTSYLNPVDEKYYFRGIGHILIRYIGLILMAPLLWINYKMTRSDDFNDNFRRAERLFFHFVMLAFLGSELISVLALLRISDSDKLALSILWGCYALGLIVYGLMKDQKFIRIAAIALFGITLIKLFFYDMAAMGTIAKIMVMIVLGILLLVASFLYNKFKKTPDVQG